MYIYTVVFKDPDNEPHILDSYMDRKSAEARCAESNKFLQGKGAGYGRYTVERSALVMKKQPLATHIVREPSTVDVEQRTYIRTVYSCNSEHDLNVDEDSPKNEFRIVVWRYPNGYSAAHIEFPKTRYEVCAWGPIIRLYNLIGDAMKAEGLDSEQGVVE